MIELVDDQFGRLLDALEAAGQAERTVVVFTSDHGESAGDHGLTQKGCRFFDGLTRVPLIWRWPGRFVAGLRSDALVELTDIAPTLLEIAGLPVPEETQGRSLLPILRGAAPSDEHRDYVRCEYLDAVDFPGHTRATMYRNRRWKLNVYHNHGLGELYDMQADPHEFDNLWDSPDHRELVRDDGLLQASFNATVMALGRSRTNATGLVDIASSYWPRRRMMTTSSRARSSLSFATPWSEPAGISCPRRRFRGLPWKLELPLAVHLERRRPGIDHVVDLVG